MNVLLVDKHPATFAALQGAARRIGIEINVVSVRSVECGLNAVLRESTFDVTLLDMDFLGKRACSLIEELYEANVAMVVAISSFERAGDVARALRLGVWSLASRRQLHSVLLDVKDRKTGATAGAGVGA